MKNIKIGKHIVPLWLVAILLISGIGIGALAYHAWNTLIIPLEVEEPLEILNYPSMLSLFPAETLEFNLTLRNHASANYSVTLDFSLDNATYQDNYVRFSDEIYIVVSGEQNLTAWVKVESYAPPVNASLTIDFRRDDYPYGLVGYWRLDEGRGNIAHDSSGYDNHGLISGGVLWVDGKFGKALQLGGGGNYVLVPHTSDLEFTGVHPFTLEAWIKPDSPQGQSSLAANVIDKYSNYGLVYDHGNSDARGVIFRSGGTWYHSGEVVISSGVWHHYVGVYDPPYLIVYLDGNEVARREVGSRGLDINSNNIVFGTNMQLTSQYNGIIDEVRIYRRALSAEEVEARFLDLLP